MTSWKTQDSKDDGVDAVAVNEDPIVGGLCIIQAKRYSKIAGVEAVHALAGVMDDKNAGKGVLVTTSWVGKASRDFAARNGSRIEIIEGRHLKFLLKKHLGLDVLICLPKLPPRLGAARRLLAGRCVSCPGMVVIGDIAPFPKAGAEWRGLSGLR